jgi:Heparinase II/III N-terminus/Heparinase II/III-like protein
MLHPTTTPTPSCALHPELSSLPDAPTDAPQAFLREPYASMAPDRLLGYFQTRNSPRYFSVSQGSPDDVKRAERILKNEFAFNHEIHQLPDPFDWKVNPSRDIEWLILLHKFYYARDLAGAYAYTKDERYVHKWVALVSTWISDVPDGFIDSQVTGRRLQQWLLAYHYFISKHPSASITPQFLEAFIRSVYTQTRYLCRHLTPEGNHRTIELYAIFLVAVMFPELKDASSFLDFSKDELLKNIEHDLLADGVHRELSTDYHHTVLKNYLRVKELAVLNKIALSPTFDDLVRKALEFSIHIHKPDGLIPAINDADSLSYLSLLKKAHVYYPNPHLRYVVTKGEEGTPPPERCKAFPTSGYSILRGSWTHAPYEEGMYLFFDCGRLGYSAHGHYDLLNIEAAAFGHSLIVDPGRYTYCEESPDGINWRRIFKSTAYHNTVAVDGKDQSPYRPGRPIPPEPKPMLKQFITTDGFDFVHGQAVSPEYSVVHERLITCAAAEYWIITDLLRGQGAHRYDLHFHLAPRALGRTTLSHGDTTIRVSSPNLVMAQPMSPTIHTALLEGFVSLQYGHKLPAPIIRFTQNTDRTTVFHTVLFPYRTIQPDLTIKELVVNTQEGRCHPEDVTALQITVRSEASTHSDYLLIAHDSSRGEYTFEDVTCRSPLLFLRKDAHGRILKLHAEDLHSLQIEPDVLMHDTATPKRVSYSTGQARHVLEGNALWETIERINARSR